MNEIDLKLKIEGLEKVIKEQQESADQYKVKPLWENMRPRTDYEEYLTNKGHNLGNCEWMVHDIAQVITKSDYRKVVFNDLF